MLPGPIINLCLVGFTCLLMIVYLTKFVFRYKHKHESNLLCTSTILFCLLIVLLTAFVLPVDIFLVSFIKEPDGSFKDWVTNKTLHNIDVGLDATYYSLYGITCILVAVVLPFLHFFNEESETNHRERFYSAVKCTFGFAIVLILLLFIGAFFENSLDPNDIFDKILPRAEETRAGRAISLVLAVVTLLGFINVSFYTAAGLFSWPIGMLFGTTSVSGTFDTIVDQEELYRVRVTHLREKARTDRLTAREQAQLDKAEEDLRLLDRQETVLSEYRSTWSYKFRKIIRPVHMLIGLAFAALSILLLVSLIIVNVDRILSSAGPRKGYVLLKTKIFNPFEYICTEAQDLIFVGPMPVLIVTSFLVIATISGIRNLGLWLMFARLHTVNVERTPPRALLFFCMTMILAATAFNLTLYSLAPQYITFGNQNFRSPGPNNTFITQPCTIEDYHTDCILTRNSKMLFRMMSQVWIFGALFYWLGWSFVVVSVISLSAYLRRGKTQAVQDLVSDEDEFEE